MFKLQLWFVLYFCLPVIASQSYIIKLTNGVQVDSYNFEFDVIIKCTSGNLELTSYQAALNFNNNISNGGNLSFSYKDGTSELTNLPIIATGIYLNDSLNVLTFASLPGYDIITENEMLLGRFVLNNTHIFIGSDANITWNFNGNINTVLTGTNFTNITNQDNHFSDIGGVISGNDSTLNGSELTGFDLMQNYPNPFNPSTKISFKISKPGYVKLVVFNTLGGLVEILVNKFLSPGIFTFNFNGENLSSGIYFYRLEYNNFKMTKKMLLLK